MALLRIIKRIIGPKLVSRTKALILKKSFLTKLFRIKFFSLNDLDKQLERYLNFDNGYFVEIGANDGVNQSNTLYFERFRNWKGILIEPSAINYKELIRNRSSENYFKNAACVGPTYTSQTVRLVYSNLMTSTLGVTSDILNPFDHARRGNEFWEGSPFIFEASALTLNSIMVEADAPSFIDFLSLDVEGVELEVLKGVDHSRFRFGHICVESRQFQKLHRYLIQQQYSYIGALSVHDHLFKSLRK